MLFKEVTEQYPDGLPSEGTLKNELLKKEFNPSVISDVIAVLRGSLSLAEGVDVAYNEAMEQEQVPDSHSYVQSKAAVLNPSAGTARKPSQLATQVLAISIPRNLSVDIAVKGDELKREDLDNKTGSTNGFGVVCGLCPAVSDWGSSFCANKNINTQTQQDQMQEFRAQREKLLAKSNSG